MVLSDSNYLDLPVGVHTLQLAHEKFDTLQDDIKITHGLNSEAQYELFIDRTLKVSLHEVGHNLGLTDHASYKHTADGTLCPMSRGEFNKFGYRGYVKVIIDGRGLFFCDECTHFLKSVYGKITRSASDLLKDGLVVSPN